jgi:hypothetical protein
VEVTGFETDPWTIAERDFPASGSLEQQVRFVLGYAILAPSSHNSQPWAFHLDVASDREAIIELRADRSRRLAVVDPDDRELTISCGGALFFLRLALRCFGFQPAVEPFPAPDDADFLARVRITPGGTASSEERLLLAALTQRVTNRAQYTDQSVPNDALQRLTAAAAAEGAWFQVAGAAAQETIAGLVAEGDRLQWANPAFRRELASWMRPDHTDAHDGMPGYGFGMGELESLAAPLLIRTFDMGRGRAAKDEELVAGSPVLAVLGTATDTRRDRVAAGEAVAHLLQATAAGISVSFLNQPNEVPALRRRLAEAIGQTGWPQMLIRLGYGPAAKHPPRLTVDEVLTTG